MKNYLVASISLVFLLATLLFAQNDLAITVSNQDIGLVRELRKIELKKGRNAYLLTDIPERIDPTSVLVESKDGSFQVLEQNFEYDLINVSKVLNKSIDRKIWLEDPSMGRIEGQLLAFSSSYLMLLDEENHLQIIPRNDRQRVLLKEYKAQENEFLTRPTLVWQVEAERSGAHAFALSYLTYGLSWHANYVGKINQNDDRMNLACWVTVKNKSGKSYRNARLKLMAGNLNLVRQKLEYSPNAISLQKRTTKRPRIQEKEFFEYHLYTLQGKTTLLQNQVKQIQLFARTDVKVQKKYQVSSYNPQEVTVKLVIKNTKKNKLGIPFPKGKFRLYKQDGKDLEFIGEDAIDHTPRNEEIKLTIGKAFDIVANREILKTERPTNRKQKLNVQYTIKNHKKQDIEVEVLEYLPGYSEKQLLSSTLKPVEVKDRYYKFRVPVKAQSKTQLTIKYLLIY